VRRYSSIQAKEEESTGQVRTTFADNPQIQPTAKLTGEGLDENLHIDMLFPLEILVSCSKRRFYS
jgi:hypothetical protein